MQAQCETNNRMVFTTFLTHLTRFRTVIQENAQKHISGLTSSQKADGSQLTCRKKRPENRPLELPTRQDGANITK